MARVLDRGTMRSVAALVRTCGLDGIERFLREGGARQVTRCTLALWAAVLRLDEAECTPTSSPRNRSPYWVD